MEETNSTPVSPTSHTPLIALTILLILSVIVSGYLGYQNLQLQKQITKLNIQPTPTPTTDPTANWKIFSSADTDFTFSYPSDFDNLKQNKLAKNSVSLTAKNGDNFSVSILSGGTGIECQEIIEESKVNIDGIKAIMTSLAGITNDNCDTGGKKSFMASFQKDKLYYLLDYTYSTDNKKDNKSIFDQIISTFKFVNPNVETFISQTLGISFKHQKDSAVKVIGNKVYVYSVETKPETGQYVEIFNKDANDSLITAVTKKFMNGFSSNDCVVELYKNSSDRVTINVAGGYAELQEMFEKVKKCPPTYTAQNGISYFWMDPKYPTKFAFFSIGQYAISGDSDKNTWQDTFEFTK